MLRARLAEQEIRGIIDSPGEGNLVTDGIVPIIDLDDRTLSFTKTPLTDAQTQGLAALQGCIVIVPEGTGGPHTIGTSRLLESARPRAAMAAILAFVRDGNRREPWTSTTQIADTATISPLAVISGAVEIGEHVIIEPFCTIGPDVNIGTGSIVHAGARIHPHVRIGHHCVIGANSVIGSAGFGFVRDSSGEKTRIPHLGGVIIGSHVEIGALTVIQHGTIGPTRIDDHVKIGETSAIGHNAFVQRGASIVAGVIIGGSAVVEPGAWIGMNATVRDGRRVGARARVGMDVSVQSDLTEKAIARAPLPDVRARRVRRPGS